MDYFPQLLSACAAQYPLRRKHSVRCVIARTEDGRREKYLDAARKHTIWELQYSGLTGEELESILSLFHGVEGQLKPFTFIDPAGNLLAWSEGLSQPAWSVGPLITVTGGQPDPLGGARATHLANGGGASQEAAQTLALPASYRYSFSLYARSAAETEIALIRRSPARTDTLTAAIGNQWQRIKHSARLDTADETVTFAIEIPAAGQVTVFGLQAEAQPDASEYKRTTSRNGAYPGTHFLDDHVTPVTTGPGEHALALRLISRWN